VLLAGFLGETLEHIRILCDTTTSKLSKHKVAISNYKHKTNRQWGWWTDRQCDNMRKCIVFLLRTSEELVGIELRESSVELTLDIVQLRHLAHRHHGESEVGGILIRVVQHVVGSDELAGILIGKEVAVVGVDREAGRVGRSHHQAQLVGGSEHIGGVPEGASHLVHLTGLHHHGGQAALTPSHANGAVLDETGLAGGVHIRHTDLQQTT
jgi:hypothetical protein